MQLLRIDIFGERGDIDSGVDSFPRLLLFGFLLLARFAIRRALANLQHFISRMNQRSQEPPWATYILPLSFPLSQVDRRLTFIHALDFVRLPLLLHQSFIHLE